MPHSFSQIYIHLVFGTKYREAVIPEKFRIRLFGYMVGILREMQCHALQCGGTEDHVHILLSLCRDHSIAEVAKQLKRQSSKWIKSQAPEFLGFQWQRGYGAFSVSHSNLEQVVRYIQNQVRHHKRMTFAEECALIAEKYGISITPRSRGAQHINPGQRPGAQRDG